MQLRRDPVILLQVLPHCAPELEGGIDVGHGAFRAVDLRTPPATLRARRVIHRIIHGCGLLWKREMVATGGRATSDHLRWTRRVAASAEAGSGRGCRVDPEPF
ncbi:hypothetical protein GCM10027515_08160 [Schumannella luteola]